MAAPARDSGNERGFQQQPLAVDDVLELVLAQLADEPCDFAPSRRRERSLAPASRGNGDHLVYCRVKADKRRKGLLHNPVEMRVRMPAPCVHHRRHLMDHITERGRLYEQDVRHALQASTAMSNAKPASVSCGVSEAIVSQRQIVVLTRWHVDTLRPKHGESASNARAGCMRHDHIIDIAPFGCNER